VRVLQAYKSKKYLLRILVSVTLLIVAILVFAASALQFNAERSAVRMQQEADRKVMNQIQFNVSYMTDVLKNLALSLYLDPNIAPLFTLRDPGEMATIRSMNTLKQAYLSSSFLHSIAVYNGFEDLLYPVGELALNRPDYENAERLAELLKKPEKLPRMQLVPMRFGDGGQTVDFFSLIVYQNFNPTAGRGESALIVNIKPEWLYDNLRAMNGFTAPERSGIFLLDEEGSVIVADNAALVPDGEELRKQLAVEAREAESFGSFSGKLGGKEKLLVTYLGMKDTGWTIVGVQPYSAVVGGIGEMRSTSIAVSSAFVLIGVMLAFLMSHKLYRPVQRLLNQLGIGPESGAEAGGKGRDELTAVAGVYSAMMQKLHRTSNERDQQRLVVRNYYLRTLIGNSKALGSAELAEKVEQTGLRIDANGPYRLVIAKVDDCSGFLRLTSAEERSLYGFAVENIAEEIIGQSRFRCEIADMRSDHWAMLISPIGAAAPEEEELLRLLRLVQETVYGYYKLSLTMTVSGTCMKHDRISELYAETLHASSHKLLFGHRAIITPEMIARRVRDDEDYVFPEEAEKKLAESIRVNHLAGMENAVSEILRELSAYHYDRIVHGLLHIVDLIKSVVRDLNRNRVVPLRIDLGSLSRKVLEKETMAEIEELIVGVCRDIHGQAGRQDNEKNAALVDAIKEIIELNYKDRNLNLQGIAAMLHMTPAYVGRIFKTSEQSSVAEYLNDVRLKHAQQYLETRSFSIKEIMEAVGYVNESTFFKLFKKSFGVTPKEYRLKRALG